MIFTLYNEIGLYKNDEQKNVVSKFMQIVKCIENLNWVGFPPISKTQMRKYSAQQIVGRVRFNTCLLRKIFRAVEIRAL